jgi:Transglycosylase SLT domain/Peptidase family M23
MGRKLFLISMLVVLAAATAAAIASADSVITTGQSGVSVNLPGGSSLPPVGTLPQCSDLKDNDGDGVTDLADPDCSGPLDNAESGTSGTGDTSSTSTTPSTTSTSPSTTTPSGGHTTTGGGTGAPGNTTTGGTGGSVGGTGQGGVTSTGGGNRGHIGSSRRGHVRIKPDQDSTPMPQTPERKPNGVPTNTNPGLTIANFGTAPAGVPDFVISQFSIPPFLLPIYQACGTQYGIPWQVLAGINRIETDFGTNLNVSTAGAVGWMQFLPSTWKAYGVDANGDGRADPYNPVDAICAAARYLKAAGGDKDIRSGIFAYNHADWYVDEVLLYARQYGQLPADLIGSLTGLTEGDRFPVAAKARYADDIAERAAARRAEPRRGVTGNVADVVTSSPTRRGINIYAKAGSPVVAVNDGTIKKIGHSKKLGRYVVLADAYGNRFTYAQLGSLSNVYPVPKKQKLTKGSFRIIKPQANGKKTTSAPTATAGVNGAGKKVAPAKATHAKPKPATSANPQPTNTEDSSRRLFAYPERKHNVDRASLNGQLNGKHPHSLKYETTKAYSHDILRYDSKTMDLKTLKKGSTVVAGTVLGRLAASDGLAPHLNFAIQPAGRGAPKIDPKPILDGWKLLEDTAIYRAAGKNPFASTSVSQALLASKTQLERQVLTDPRLSIYECGRNDIKTGQIDRRILAAMEYLADNGFRLTITALKCGHSMMTSSGYVSEHYYGDAMDIAVVNGIPIVGNQGPGTITEAVIKTLLKLQGNMEPHQVISLMDLGGPSFALPDHYDHIHVGYAPQPGDVDYGGKGSAPTSTSGQLDSLLKGKQWKRLIGRIAQIRNPEVPTTPSRFSLKVRKGSGD